MPRLYGNWSYKPVAHHTITCSCSECNIFHTRKLQTIGMKLSALKIRDILWPERKLKQSKVGTELCITQVSISLKWYKKQRAKRRADFGG